MFSFERFSTVDVLTAPEALEFQEVLSGAIRACRGNSLIRYLHAVTFSSVQYDYGKDKKTNDPSSSTSHVTICHPSNDLIQSLLAIFDCGNYNDTAAKELHIAEQDIVVDKDVVLPQMLINFDLFSQVSLFAHKLDGNTTVTLSKMDSVVIERIPYAAILKDRDPEDIKCLYRLERPFRRDDAVYSYVDTAFQIAVAEMSIFNALIAPNDIIKIDKYFDNDKYYSDNDAVAIEDATVIN